MNWRKSFNGAEWPLTVIFVLLIAAAISAQTVVTDLSSALDKQHVSIVEVRGNGNSSGTVLLAHLINNSTTDISVKVNLDQPLYFVNSGPNQNMVVTQVYYDDGSYFSDRANTFITIRAGNRHPVVFMAFCADFERENPSERDRFLRGVVPIRLKQVLTNIRNYSASNPKEDIVVAAQAALWLSQGASIQDINERFPVSLSEEKLARRFLE